MTRTPGSEAARQAGEGEPGRRAGEPFSEGARLWREAIEAQAAQWRSSLDRLGRGQYGPLEVARDAQDSWQRAAGLYSRLAGLWWQGWMGAGRTAWPAWRGGWCGWPGSAGGTAGGSSWTATPPSDPSSDPSSEPPGDPTSEPVPGPVPRPQPEPAAAAGPPPETRAVDAEPPSPEGDAPKAAAGRKQAKREQPTALAVAERFLREQLTDGECAAQKLLRRAAEAGISETTLRRARKLIGANSRRRGFGPESQVFWGLTES